MESEYYGPVTAIGFIKNHLYYAYNRVVKNASGERLALPKDAGLIKRITDEFIISGDTLYDEAGAKIKSVSEHFPSLMPREHILDAKTINGALFIITTHGYVFSVRDGETKMFRPTEAGVLYSACICELAGKVCFIYGTIFSGIQVYFISGVKLKKEYTLTGHKGSIFALEARGELVASASDDRTVCVWNLTTRKRLFSSTGHRARIWALSWLDDATVVSASEDADLRVYDVTSGQCLQVLEGHLGKHVWSVACQDGFVYSGGNDGSVRKWNVKQEAFEEHVWDLPPNHIKSFSIKNQDCIDVALANGLIVRCDVKSGAILERLVEDETFANYSVLCEHFVGSLNGHVYDLTRKEKIDLSNGDKVCNIFTSSEDVLVNCASGHIFINQIKAAVKGTVTSFLSTGDSIWVGFRDGRLVCHEKALQEKCTLQKRTEAITGLILHENVLYACDRGGHLMTIDREDVVISSDLKIHPGFLEGMLIYKDNLLITGFHQKNFIVYDVVKSTTLVKIPCGGGHRQWQVELFDDTLVFVYLRLKKMHVVEAELAESAYSELLVPPINGREIRCGIIFANILITGDEEGTLVVSSLQDLHITPKTFIRGAHNNGIKAIKQISPDLFATAGSGEELKIWKLEESSLRLKGEFTSGKDDVRFMDLEHYNNQLAVAGSDGSVRFYSIDGLSLLSETKLRCCITGLVVCKESLYAADSQGTIHNVSDNTSQKLHKNSILSMLAFNGHIVSGGDDCQVIANGKPLAAMHGSSVTGLTQLSANSFASVGVDRRIVIWKDYGVSERVIMTNVDDASCIIHHNGTLVVLGCGIELIKL